MGEKYKELVGKIEDRSHEVLDKWREKSNEFVRNFIEMYGTMVSFQTPCIFSRILFFILFRFHTIPVNKYCDFADC